MNKVAIILVLAGLLLLGGFVYLRSRPTPEPVVDQSIPVKSPETIEENSLTPTIAMGKPITDIKQYEAPPEMQIDTAKQYSAEVETSKGKLTIELFPNEAPVAVNNFVFLAKEGFYDQTVFHRIMSGFMIQGGDPLGNGTGGPGYTFADEPISRDYKRGTVAMANAGPNTNGSQFFIMHQDTAGLPKDYVILGKLVGEESLATLDAIANTPVVANDYGEVSLPTEKVTVQSVEIKEK